MATWNGESNTNGEQNNSFIKPSASQTQLAPEPPKEICPDSEENVNTQTEDLFRNFVYQRYRNDNIQQSYDNNPVNTEIVNLPKLPDSPAAEIGRQLARIGDEINEKYKDEFDKIIDSLNIGQYIENAYEAFSGIARRIFLEGINWGRIVTLLCFGYRFAMKVVRDQLGNFANFMQSIARILLRFLVTERISEWIADHGGWHAALAYIPTVDFRTFASIMGLACLSVVAVIAWNRYNNL